MAFVDAFNKRLRPVLDACDDVSRLLGTQTDIQMCKIVVVGDQSSGKSSLIESMFGFSLPRGTDIVTRTPIQVEHRLTKGEPYAELSYRKQPDAEKLNVCRISDMDTIEEWVCKATEAVAGSGKGVVDSTIYLRVHSDRLPDLTVLDLPGITRNAIEGQPENIEEIVTAMIQNHIEGEMTVILCVIPANVDFSTAAAIKMAKKHDALGERTMGVVTKIDLTESGAEMVGRLAGSGNNLRLKLGFIPVRNRTAHELKEGTSLESVRANEEAFFKSHPQLSKLPGDRRGIGALVNELARVQLQTLSKSLPGLKKQIRQKLDASRAELEGMQGGVVGSESEALMRLQQLTSKLEVQLLHLRQGNYQALLAGDDSLKVARRVHEMALEYLAEVEEECNLAWFMEGECFEQLQERSKDTRGAALPNFLSSSVFQTLYMDRVQSKLLQPALDLVACVRLYVEEEVLGALTLEVFKSFPRLLAAVRDQVQDLLREQEAAARAHIGLMIKQQEAIHTVNHYYMDTVNKIKADSRKMRGEMQKHNDVAEYDHSDMARNMRKEHGDELYDFINSLARAVSNEDQALKEMQISLKAYGKVVLKRVCDNVALGVRMLLVDEVGDKLASTIQQGIHTLVSGGAGEDDEDMDGDVATTAGQQGSSGVLELMQDPQQARRREELARVVGSLERAAARLKNITV